MIFGPSDAEFLVELEVTKKCVHQECPKDRDSDGKTANVKHAVCRKRFQKKPALVQ